MINPTVFIGLGSGGAEITKYLRRFLYEQYERPSLPFFKFVNIETQKNFKIDEGDIPDSEKEENAIEYVNAIISNLQEKKTFYVTGQREHFKPWLNSAIFDETQRSFEAGASNIRMAGRMILLENWEKITSSLNRAYNAVTQPENFTKTVDFFDKYLKRKKIERSVENYIRNATSANIYIYGSLCGGTCSGTFIDIAYYMSLKCINRQAHRNAESLNTVGNIYGIFTTLDDDLAQDQNNYIKLANNCGALVELNYYNHTKTIFNEKFPFGNLGNDNYNDPPFDYFYIVSPSCTPADKFRDSKGGFDANTYSAFNRMVSLNLFTEVIGGLVDIKNAIRTDLISRGNYYSEDKNNNSRSFASFGISAFWFPKFNIAGAVACKAAGDLIDTWLDEKTDAIIKERIQKEAKDFVMDLKRSIDELLLTVGGNIKDSIINPWFARNKIKLLKLEPELFEAELSSPQNKEDDFKLKLAPRVERDPKNFENIILANLPNFNEKFFEQIKIKVKQELDGKKKLIQIKILIEEIDKELKEWKSTCPATRPGLNLSTLNYSLLYQLKNNGALKLLFLNKKALDKAKEKILNDSKELIINTLNKLRDHLLRETIDKAMQVLEEIKIENSISKLKSIKETVGSRYKELSEIQSSLNIELIFQEKNIEEDINGLFNTIKPSIFENEVLQNKKFSEFIDKSKEEIKNSLYEYFHLKGLSKIQTFDIAEKICKNLESGNYPQYQRIISRSQPYQLFVNGYITSIPQEAAPNFISGRNEETISRLNGISSIKFAKQKEELVLDNILLFYREEAAFTIEDLQIINKAKEIFLTADSKFLPKYGISIRKDGISVIKDTENKIKFEGYFSTQKFLKELKVKDYLRIALGFFDETEIIVKHNGDKKIFRYESENGVNIISVDDYEDKSILEKFCSNKDAFDTFINKVNTEICKFKNEAELQRNINNYLAKKFDEHKIDVDQYNESRDFYKKFIEKYAREIFPRQEKKTTVV